METSFTGRNERAYYLVASTKTVFSSIRSFALARSRCYSDQASKYRVEVTEVTAPGIRVAQTRGLEEFNSHFA